MAHLLMLHGHPVGYLPPTMASEILYDNNNTVAEKIDDIDLTSGGTIGGNLSVIRNNTGTSNINSYLDVGNNIAEGTTGATRGILRVYGLGAYNAMVYPSTLTNNREIKLPDKNGTIALDIGVATGTTASSSDWSSYSSLPSGFTASNCVIIGVQFEPSSGVWRSGDGASGNQYRFFAEMSGSSVRVYNNDPSAYSKTFKVTLHKYA